ncbi:PDGLE domain-containing protein [Marmoricola sp. RAF53]|uniref:PDGLE domain-containing protein n=1 Tax=Marmoricola sp. RAF53 TaxID=3233059 RepID=UPI003F9B9757
MSATSTRRVSTRTLVIAGLLVAVVIAGFVSHYASSHPDGLMYVAGEKGFAKTESRHGTADGPMAGYATQGVHDDRLSGGIAGVTGVVVVLLLAGGLAFVLRRRGTDPS